MYVKIELGLEIYIWVETTCTTTAKQSWELLRSNSMKRNRLWDEWRVTIENAAAPRARRIHSHVSAHASTSGVVFHVLQQHSGRLLARSIVPCGRPNRRGQHTT